MFKRILFFGFGLASYAFFFATFLYFIAFVGGFVVPHRLDAPLEGSIGAAIAINLALVALFGLQHSVMARRGFKERWTQVLPWSIERSTFVIDPEGKLKAEFRKVKVDGHVDDVLAAAKA